MLQIWLAPAQFSGFSSMLASAVYTNNLHTCAYAGLEGLTLACSSCQPKSPTNRLGSACKGGANMGHKPSANG